MRSLSPAEVVEQFGHCARALDEDGARELAIGWDAPGDAPRRLYKQAAQGRWELRPLGPAQVAKDRSVQQLTLYWPERNRTVGSVWAHLVELPEGWRLAGAQGDLRIAGLFVGGLTPPVLSAGALPPNAEAEAWGAARIEELKAELLRSQADVEAVWPVPVLGRVPGFPSVEVAPSLRGIDANHPALAAHAKIRDAVAAHPRLVLTSSVSGEGKSTLTGNLAYARGLMGQRVAVIDGDLRLPRVWRRWRVDPGPGLCECVEGLDPIKALQEGDAAGVKLLTAGRAPDDPTQVLAAAGPVVDAVASSVDGVLVDGAPAVEFDDAFAIAKAAAAELLVVVELGKTRRSDFAALRARFEERGVTPVGVVLNRMPMDDAGELRAMAAEEGVQMRLLGSRWLEPVSRALVGLEFARPGEPPKVEWVVLQKGDNGFEQVGRSKVRSIAALLKDVNIDGPKAYGSEWRSEQVTQAFAVAVDNTLERIGSTAGASDDPSAGLAQIIKGLVSEAASGKTPKRLSVPVTVDVGGEAISADGSPAQKMPDGVGDAVMAAVEKVLGKEAAAGGAITQEDIGAHGPEIAAEVLGSLLGQVLPEAVEVGDGRKVDLNVDLASLFGSMLGKKKADS